MAAAPASSNTITPNDFLSAIVELDELNHAFRHGMLIFL